MYPTVRRTGQADRPRCGSPRSHPPALPDRSRGGTRSRLRPPRRRHVRGRLSRRRPLRGRSGWSGHRRAPRTRRTKREVLVLVDHLGEDHHAVLPAALASRLTVGVIGAVRVRRSGLGDVNGGVLDRRIGGSARGARRRVGKSAIRRGGPRTWRSGRKSGRETRGRRATIRRPVRFCGKMCRSQESNSPGRSCSPRLTPFDSAAPTAAGLLDSWSSRTHQRDCVTRRRSSAW